VFDRFRKYRLVKIANAIVTIIGINQTMGLFLYKLEIVSVECVTKTYLEL
jgi:hypothetical protein